MGFVDIGAWREAQLQAPLWTPSDYGTRGFTSEGIFIADKSEYDLLREAPSA